MAKRPSWGHVSRHCVHCGEVGPRVQVGNGWAHRRCIKKDAPDVVVDPKGCCVGGPLWSNCKTCPKRPSLRRLDRTTKP